MKKMITKSGIENSNNKVIAKASRDFYETYQKPQLDQKPLDIYSALRVKTATKASMKKKEKHYALETGEVINGEYVVVSVFSTRAVPVVLARGIRDNRAYVLKEEDEDLAETILKPLKHSAIPKVINLVRHKAHCFVVMEHVEGVTLSRLLQKGGALSLKKTLLLGQQLCDVLSYLHSSNPTIIHRDVKPSNILVKCDGNPVLLDFSTSKQVLPKEAETTSDENVMTVVSEGYSSPEQYGNFPLDTRSDIYSLGATLFSMLLGRAPLSSLKGKQLLGDYDKKYVGTVIEEIIGKCMEPNIDKRYSSCLLVKEELLKCLRKRNGLSKRKTCGEAIAALPSKVLCAISGFFKGEHKDVGFGNKLYRKDSENNEVTDYYAMAIVENNNRKMR